MKDFSRNSSYSLARGLEKTKFRLIGVSEKFFYTQRLYNIMGSEGAHGVYRKRDFNVCCRGQV